MKKFRLNFWGKALLLVGVPVFLGACAPTFHCTDGMKGPGCNSVSQVYENTHQGKSMSRVYDETHPAAEKAPETQPPAGLPQTIKPGDPLRSGERVLRVWMAPWVDKDEDYHDQSYVYLVLDHGRWYVEQARKRIKRRFAPHVLPPEPRAGNTHSPNGNSKTYDANIENAAIASGAGDPRPMNANPKTYAPATLK